MTDPKKETVWITIPDEATPALEAPAKPTKKAPSDKVKNRAFWGGGFVALIVFVALLFAPQEFVSLMRAQLFDGTYQVVPQFEEQQKEGTLFGEGEEEAEAKSAEEAEDQMVVEAESEAVSIQIEPVTEVEEEAASEDTGNGAEEVGDAEAVTEAESVVIDEAESIQIDGEEEVEAVASEAEEELDANTKLLQSLSKQLEEFKDKERQNEQLIQDLMQLLEDQAAGARPAATTISPSLLPQVQPTQFGQPLVQTTAQFGVGAGAGVYRYNTHTVTVSPYDVLAQNQAAQSQQAVAYQASLTFGAVQPYVQPIYTPVLAGVQGQPDTGPAETILFALLLASFGVLVWGLVRAIKA